MSALQFSDAVASPHLLATPIHRRRSASSLDRELIVDSFAGGGGTSQGIEDAGFMVDIAINHNAHALAMHRVNHPRTRHYCEDVRDINPIEVCAGRPVGLFWLSPDCTYHSRARGGKPFRDRNRARRIRGLAGVAVHWAEAVRPRIIALENVLEFSDWGPLRPDGSPCPIRRGVSFRRFVSRLQNLGYELDWQSLRGCDYGAPTTRKRLFLIGRCDRQPIVWPEPTHGPGLQPYRIAADCIDWTLPCRSIFERNPPLVEATMRRIARGLRRFVMECPKPFIITLRGTQASHLNSSARSIDEPLRTISAQGTHHALVWPTVTPVSAASTFNRRAPVATGPKADLIAAFLAKHYGGHGSPGGAVDRPLDTITTRDHHTLITARLSPAPEHPEPVRAFLIQYNGTPQAPDLHEPLHTITTRDRFGLISVQGQDYAISDIGMRTLTPRELFRAQGFPQDYVIDHGLDIEADGTERIVPLGKTQQIRMCGNSVCPPVAQAIVHANLALSSGSTSRWASGRLF